MAANDRLPYFSAYKTVFFPFQNSPKYLDPSYKMDLDIWDCFRKGKLISKQNFIRLIKMFGVILEMEKLCLISKEIQYLIQ